MIVSKKERNLHELVEGIIDYTPKRYYKKTLRGLILSSPKVNLEFVFSTDREAYDALVVVKGKTDHCVANRSIYEKLMRIYEN